MIQLYISLKAHFKITVDNNLLCYFYRVKKCYILHNQLCSNAAERVTLDFRV